MFKYFQILFLQNVELAFCLIQLEFLCFKSVNINKLIISLFHELMSSSVMRHVTSECERSWLSSTSCSSKKQDFMYCFHRNTSAEFTPLPGKLCRNHETPENIRFPLMWRKKNMMYTRRDWKVLRKAHFPKSGQLDQTSEVFGKYS